MNTVQEKWDQYEEMVVPASAGPNQRIETRRAFYAGAYAMLTTMEDLPEDISEEAGAMVLEGCKEEILAFMEIQKQVGATGAYPDGKSQEEDEGELRLAVRTSLEKGLIGMEFGKPVAWMEFSAKDARALATILLSQAEYLEENDGTRSRKV
jgi:hypothetical protein